MLNRKPMAFMSYASQDDQNMEGWMTTFRERLASAASVRIGEQFEIFQDRLSIKWGQKWKERINGSLDAATFLVAMITPAFFRSEWCRDELEKFLGRERSLGQDNLVLPVYCVDDPLLYDKAMRRQDPLAKAVMARQMEDWRQLRLEPFDSPQVRRTLARMARQIAKVAEQLKAGPAESLPSCRDSCSTACLSSTPPPLSDLDLCPVDGGEFLMGDDAGEFGAEKPAHPVRLSSFFMGKWPVTQRLWQQVMAADPSYFKGDRRPVENVSWDDVQEFLKRLNGRGEVQDFVGRLGCAGMRLPTEAEWEYAARGGRLSRGFKYSGSDLLSQVGWFERNNDKGETYEVGLLSCNELGLHDMSGNVWEWCSDWQSNDYYAACLQQGTCENPNGPAKSKNRVIRGGSCFDISLFCRSIYRAGLWPTDRDKGVGFRLALSTGRRSRATAFFAPELWASEWGWDEHGHWQAFHCGPASHVLRWIEPGRFMMGSPEDEPGRDDDETLHEVVLSEGFWLGETTCTQEFWQAVVGSSPSQFKGPLRPVDSVSWDDVQDFLERLNRMVPGLEACLPTEAQWEHACRAGTMTPFSFGQSLSTDRANYDGNQPYVGGPKGIFRNETVEVHALPCNQWGLHQMHGNVDEWCQDFYGPYAGAMVVDPTGPAGGRYRVVRGGSWNDYGGFCRSANRFRSEPADRNRGLGFRIARGRTVQSR